MSVNTPKSFFHDEDREKDGIRLLLKVLKREISEDIVDETIESELFLRNLIRVDDFTAFQVLKNQFDWMTPGELLALVVRRKHLEMEKCEITGWKYVEKLNFFGEREVNLSAPPPSPELYKELEEAKIETLLPRFVPREWAKLEEFSETPN